MGATDRPKYSWYWVYMLLCADDSIYTGITTDVSRRFSQHKMGKGGAYTRSRGAQQMIYIERRRGRGSALRREAEIKKWTRVKKLQYAKDNERYTDIQ